MNQDSTEPPSKRFKVEVNGPLTDVNADTGRTASPLNGISFTGNLANAKVISISQHNVAANSPRAYLTSAKTAPMQNVLSNVVLQPSVSPAQNTGYVKLPASMNNRNITTPQRTPTPNANYANKQSTITLSSPGGVPIKIPVQGHQLRNPVTLLQQVGNSSTSNSIFIQQPLVVQQQQARPFYVLQQSVAAGRQNPGMGQGVTTFLFPQASGNIRSQTAINLPQALQLQQNQFPQQKAQIVQAKPQLAVQSQAGGMTAEAVPVQASQSAHSAASTQQQQQHPSSSSSLTSTSSQNSQARGSALENKKRLMQFHMFSLLHVKHCVNKIAPGTCPVTSCEAMHRAVAHAIRCQTSDCKENNCTATKQLLAHLKACHSAACEVCTVAKEKVQRYQKNHELRISASNATADTTSVAQGTLQNNAVTSNTTSATLSCTSVPVEARKQWQSEVNEGLRNTIVSKLFNAVLPLSLERVNSPDGRRLLEQVKKVEYEHFEDANSKADYLNGMARKIQAIQKEFDEKRRQGALRNAAGMNGNLKDSSASSSTSSPSPSSSSAQQQLQHILSKKKEELSSNESLAPSVEAGQTFSKASFLAQELEIKLENEVKQEPTEGSLTTKMAPSNKKVWSCNELRRYLMPVLEKLYRLDPDSLQFRFPVDPVAQNLPDYFDIIKRPMDLSTIKKNLDDGSYKDPWEFVDDVWLMFNNAWLYNRKGSRVHKSCTRLAEVFEPEIDTVMKSMGFCCGKKYVFCPQVLCCYGKPMCTIPVNASYYGYQNKYAYCEPCFHEIRGEDVELSDDPTQPSIIIQKELFVKTKNSEMEPESFVRCTNCDRRQHQICSMYHEPIWPGCFVCNFCIRNPAIKRRENKFTARNLLQTKLGSYLENRLNSFLRENKSGANPVTIRVHSHVEKMVEIKPGMKNRFCNSKSMSDSLPYTAKAIFAYQEVDGSDVCFFGMHVQEYGSNCPAPNTRRVYIAYLDSINFFQPKVFRTSVYHEILIGYLDYVKKLGFATAHIWACPPSEGDDYIFHCHPLDMKIPKPKRLADWYKKMLDKAILERVVVDYKDIIKDALENGIQNATELPYFEGDFWPNVIETCISELEQEEHLRRTENAGDFEDSDSVHSSPFDYEDAASAESGLKRNHKGVQGSKKKTSTKKSAINKKNNSKAGQPYPGNDLMSKLFVMMEKHREVFFVVRLRNHHAPFANLPPIQDPDPIISTDLMDGRDNFLMICRERHHEFSSLRRAKHSTMVMLYELHSQAKDNFVYLCNYCRASVETHYHCPKCDDFDLCINCYKTKGHVHTMKKIGLDLDDDEGSSKNSVENGTVANVETGHVGSQQAAKKHSIEKFLQCLAHATTCTFNIQAALAAGGPAAVPDSCKMNSCAKMKHILQHGKTCVAKKNGTCTTCRQLTQLCFLHVKGCANPQCPLPFCKKLKLKIEREKDQRRHLANQMNMRRMEAMHWGAGTDPLNQTHVQVANHRPSGQVAARPAPQNSTVTLQQAVSQLSAQNQVPGIRQPALNVAPQVVQQVKMSAGNAVLSAEGIGEVPLSQESIQKLLTLKSQQHAMAGGSKSQLITVLKNDPQVQAFIKKQQEQNLSSPQSATNDAGNPSASSAADATPLQPRQQQIILTCNPNVLQRQNMAGGQHLGMMHLNNSNRVMLSQMHGALNPGAQNIQDTSISPQDRLSRYADQL